MGERPPNFGRVGRVVAACAVWLVVGAAVNVVVAWGLPMVLDTRFEDFTQWSNQQLPEWPYPSLPNADKVYHPWRWFDVGFDVDEGIVDRYAGLATGVSAVRFGWPMRSMALWTERMNRGDDPWVTRYAITLPTRWQDVWSGAAVPRRNKWVGGWYPLWGGLAINTALYAGVACAIWNLPRIVRWMKRRRAGLCAACGYDLHGLGDGAACPECGKANVAASAAAERRKLVAQGGAQRNPGSQ